MPSSQEGKAWVLKVGMANPMIWSGLLTLEQEKQGSKDGGEFHVAAAIMDFRAVVATVTPVVPSS